MTAYPAPQSTSPWARLIWLIPLVSVLMVAVSLWCYSQNGPAMALNADIRLDIFQGAVGLSYPLIGAFILNRRPGNVIGWIFCLIGFSSALYDFSVQYPAYSFISLHANLPLAVELTWVENWAWYIPLVLFTALVMLYPNGKPPSLGWGLVLTFVLSMIPLIIILTWIYLYPYRGIRLVLPPSQLSAEQQQQLVALQRYLIVIIGVPTLVGFPSAVSALIMRLRRSTPVEQQQIKWFLYIGGLFLMAIVLYLLLQLIFQAKWVDLVIWNGMMPALAVGLPITVVFAILRHRLFDIDLIIRRTLVYTLLTLVLVVDYLISVIVLQALLRAVLGQNSSIAVVISTLIIAALFTPVRRRVQSTIDRRFYRGHYNPDQVLSRLSSAIQTEVDLETLTASVLRSVDEAIQPESKSLWLKK